MSIESASEISVTAPNTRERRSASYHPSIWGDRLTAFECEDKAVNPWREEAEELKEKVRKMLIEDITATGLQGMLDLIDAVQRLGVSYHFEKEIDELQRGMFIHHERIVRDCDLHHTALLFRLQRQHGYRVSCDIFNKFKDSKGKFKETLATDVRGCLSLYEAAHLRVHGEDILDQALDFTTYILAMEAADSSHPLSKQIFHALRRPIRKSMPRLEARDFMSLYEESESHDQALLRFAKLDFDILQKMHQKEISIIARWWENLDFKRKLPWARDRLAECYLWILELYSEPQYALARKFVTKVIQLTSTMDDVYDNYGTQEELVLFTDAVERWEISAMDKLPEYMRLVYQALLDVHIEMEKEISKEGNAYRIGYAKEAMKTIVTAYFEESKWLNREKIPTFEEYMKVASVSCGYPMLSVASLVGMGDRVTKRDFDWMLGEPKCLKAVSVICRLMDDMVSHKFEQQREHIPSAVECYTHQHRVSEEQACQVFKGLVEDAWKDLNEAFLMPTPASKSALTRLLNLTRVMEVLYKDEDIYTHSNTRFKDYITNILFYPVEIR